MIAVDLHSILYFLGAAVLLTLMPGPDNLFVLGQSIAKGKYAGIFTSFGLCTGLVVHITAASAGISAIVYQSAVIFSVVKYAGAAYLLYLAYKSFRDRGSPIAIQTENSLNYKGLYRRGVIMNLLNPKVSLFFLAFLPQFVDVAAGHAGLQMITLGSIFLVESLILFTLISIFAGKVGQWLQRSPSISRRMNIVQGALFTWIGLQIAFSEK